MGTLDFLPLLDGRISTGLLSKQDFSRRVTSEFAMLELSGIVQHLADYGIFAGVSIKKAYRQPARLTKPDQS